MSLTIVIIIITCGISFWAWNDSRIFDLLIFNPSKTMNQKQWYRLFSGALLHADFTHLLINMFVLFSFGNVVENVFTIYIKNGRVMYVLLYILSIAAANIKTLFQHKNNSWYNAVGASGAVSAVVFSFVLFAPLEKILFFGILPVPAFIYGLLYMAYSQYMAQRGNDNIGHDAHFYGALFGFIFTGLLNPVFFTSFLKQIFRV